MPDPIEFLVQEIIDTDMALGILAAAIAKLPAVREAVMVHLKRGVCEVPVETRTYRALCMSLNKLHLATRIQDGEQPTKAEINAQWDHL